jgi:hypothetical protein
MILSQQRMQRMLLSLSTLHSSRTSLHLLCLLSHAQGVGGEEREKIGKECMQFIHNTSLPPSLRKDGERSETPSLIHVRGLQEPTTRRLYVTTSNSFPETQDAFLHKTLHMRRRRASHANESLSATLHSTSLGSL